MTRISWDGTGDKFYEVGVDQGVLYVDGQDGVPWIGLVTVSEAPSGGDARETYLDGIKIVNRSRPEDFAAKIEAYTYPVEFEACEGSQEMANGLRISQQNRKMFNLAYRTKVGNDIDGLDHAYKIHLIYNALASPTDKDYASLGDSTDPSTFNWSISTRPVRFEDPFFGVKYGAHLVLDSRVVYPWAMEAVENVLYGTDDTAPRMPSPQELLELFVDNALLKILDNGDGTWTATGPDTIITTVSTLAAFTPDAITGLFVPSAGTVATETATAGIYTVTSPTLRESTVVSGIFMNENLDKFTINWPSVVPIDEYSFNVSSL
jgi:hypothetical protein